MRLNLLHPRNRGLTLSFITPWLLKRKRSELSFSLFRISAYQTSTSYSRVITEDEADLEDKWVFRKSEILGNHLLLDGVRNENRVVSPLSFQVVLSLLAAAYGGRTRRQLLKLFDADSVDALNYFSSQISDAFSSDGDPRMRCSNALWIDDSLSLKPSFQHILQSHYKAPLHPLDFHTQAPNVTQRINSWVENETSGLVKDLIREGSLDNSVKLVFTNALYFKGSWDEDPPFPSEEDGGENENYVMVPFLAKRKVFGRVINGWGTLNHLFKKQSEDKRAFNMLFFYPVKESWPLSLEECLKAFDDLMRKKHSSFGAENPVDECGDMTPCSINFGDETLMDVCGIMTPKFNISSEVEASKVLRQLGVRLPFSGGKLTEMFSCFDDQEFYVFNIFQKAFIEINEQGTEAATSTTAIVTSGHRSDLPKAPKIRCEAHYPSLLATNSVEDGGCHMAKTRLVVQVVNPISRQCAYALCF